jgi:hypothetical protein
VTDIVLPDQATPGIDLQVWAQQATAAAVYAERVCSTSMVPAAYRGKPAEACAAILAGAELGFSPMASLRAFDNIQGVPAPKAMTLRAVVQKAGHQVEIVESTAERAVVRGRRNMMSGWQTSVWDIARASAMPQFRSNPNYKTNPAAMLVARATAEVCRWVASDAIMGMPYAAEEIADERTYEAAPVARRITPADLDETPPTTDEDRRAVFHQIEPPAAEPRTEAQRKHMFALWGELGYGDDANRATRLDLTSKFIGREVATSNDLTVDEAAVVIARLEARKAEKQGGES